MSFEDLFRTRALEGYGAFLLPHLRDDMTLLDCGCGPGSMTYELAGRLERGRVVGLDRGDGFRAAIEYERAHRRPNLAFVRGDVGVLPFPDAAFDAVFAHSIVETLPQPVESLREMRRVLRPGGVIGVASVDYGGVLIGGPEVAPLERFYELKEEVWRRAWASEPRRGRLLATYLHEAGFRDVVASARYISYGTPDATRAFGEDRARECEAGEFARDAVGLGLDTAEELTSIAAAWRAWGATDGAVLAFPWGNAVGRT